MPSLYGDNLEAVVSGGEQVTADLGEALYLVMQGLAGKAPRVNTDNNHWEVYDNDTQAWVDTGVAAQGPRGETGADGADGTDGADGVSPEVTITSITGGHRVTITDVEHPTGQSFNVLDGAIVGTLQADGTLYVEDMSLVADFDSEVF